MLKVEAVTSAEHEALVKWLGQVHGLGRLGLTERLGPGRVAVGLYTYEYKRKEAEAAVKALNRLQGTRARLVPAYP